MTNWDQAEYQRIKNVEIQKNSLNIEFMNNDIVIVPLESVIPIKSINDLMLETITFNDFEISISSKDKIYEIPWDKIRVITDKEFSKHIAVMAEEQAKLVGGKIKTLRENKGLRGNELAERAGITPQTISRIEQGHTDISFTTLRKILAAMGCSLKDLANQEIEFEFDKSKKSFSYLMKRLSKAGLDTNLVTKKIFPIKLQNALNLYPKDQPELILDEATSYINSIYGWHPNEIWSTSKLELSNELVDAAYFKSKRNVNETQIKAYSHYAVYMAKILLKATTSKELDYPEDIESFKADYIKKYHNFDFESLFSYAWGMGICVLPLNDSGIFHGASWNINGRHVVVLKQKTNFHARWIFDLLHELYHVFAHLEKSNSAILETEEISPILPDITIEEQEANTFANQVIFGNRAEEVAEKCIEQANWKLENLKRAVLTVSKKENIREDFISNYMAFRLGLQGQNWWGTASKIQVTEPDPFNIAVKILKQNIELNKLNPMDQNLLHTALTN